MLFAKKKPVLDPVAFRKACVVVDSCVNYTQLKNAMKYVDLFLNSYMDYKSYSHLHKLISKKMAEVPLN